MDSQQISKDHNFNILNLENGIIQMHNNKCFQNILIDFRF